MYSRLVSVPLYYLPRHGSSERTLDKHGLDVFLVSIRCAVVRLQLQNSVFLFLSRSVFKFASISKKARAMRDRYDSSYWDQFLHSNKKYVKQLLLNEVECHQLCFILHGRYVPDKTV